ncbi:hypothetical protein D3C81_2104470 [compost metagenome]
MFALSAAYWGSSPPSPKICIVAFSFSNPSRNWLTAVLCVRMSSRSAYCGWPSATFSSADKAKLCCSRVECRISGLPSSMFDSTRCAKSSMVWTLTRLAVL